MLNYIYRMNRTDEPGECKWTSWTLDEPHEPKQWKPKEAYHMMPTSALEILPEEPSPSYLAESLLGENFKISNFFF